ncbi:MAG: hypothetical protein NTY70_09405, partial [Burkholderiales bacterium]|nr:hypothetical protein [Burkholderiales bacterium]
ISTYSVDNFVENYLLTPLYARFYAGLNRMLNLKAKNISFKNNDLQKNKNTENKFSGRFLFPQICA